MKREHFQKSGKKWCCTSTKKESKNLIKNYRPITILSIFSKSFEKKIISLFNYFRQITFYRVSGFIPWDSCVAQLLRIAHEITKVLTVARRRNFFFREQPKTWFSRRRPLLLLSIYLLFCLFIYVFICFCYYLFVSVLFFMIAN